MSNPVFRVDPIFKGVYPPGGKENLQNLSPFVQMTDVYTFA